MQADGALNQKLAALVKINETWAAAMADSKVVPDVYIAGSGGGKTPSSMDFMNLMTAKAAKDLQVNTNP